MGVLALSATAPAASWLDANAHNGVSLLIKGSYGFVPAVTSPSPGTTGALTLALPAIAPAGLGGSGTGTAQGSTTSTVHFGGPGSDDRLEIVFSGTARP